MKVEFKWKLRKWKWKLDANLRSTQRCLHYISLYFTLVRDVLRLDIMLQLQSDWLLDSACQDLSTYLHLTFTYEFRKNVLLTTTILYPPYNLPNGQLNSSLPSGQSLLRSHLLEPSIHCRDCEQVNWESLHCGPVKIIIFQIIFVTS